MAMRISELLREENVAVAITPTDKNSVISAVIEMVASDVNVEDIEAVRTAVFDREDLMSTGVGKGLALPHAKTTGVRKTVAALAVTSSPIEFDAVDSLPVRIVFLLVGPPDSKSSHVRILSRISRLMNREDVRQDVLSSASPSELLQRLDKHETKLIPN